MSDNLTTHHIRTYCKGTIYGVGTGIYQPCTYMLHVGILPHAHINTQYIHIQVEKFISGIYKSQTRRQNIPFNV